MLGCLCPRIGARLSRPIRVNVVMVLTAVFLDALVYAAWLFLASVGMTLIYGVMRILNIAHGSFYAIGAYAAASAVGAYFSLGLPAAGSYLVLFLAAICAGVVIGLIVERGFLQFMYGRDEVLMVLVTYALFLVLDDLVKIVWGVNPYFAFQPYGYLGLIEIYDLPYQVYDLLFIVLAAVCGFAKRDVLQEPRQDGTRLPSPPQLHDVPWTPAMLRDSHFGGHFGCVNRRFIRRRVAPILVDQS